MSYKAEFDQEQANRATFKAYLLDYWVRINETYSNLLLQHTLLTINDKNMSGISTKTESSAYTQQLLNYLSMLRTFWELINPHLKRITEIHKSAVYIHLDDVFKSLDLADIKKLHQDIGQITAPFFELSQSMGLEYSDKMPTMKEQKPF